MGIQLQLKIKDRKDEGMIRSNRQELFLEQRLKKEELIIKNKLAAREQLFAISLILARKFAQK